MKNFRIIVIALAFIVLTPEYASLADAPIFLDVIKPEPPIASDVKETKIRKVTAYNTVKEQTDGDPCIAASNVNICPLIEAGELICAANFVPFYTYLEIKGIGRCLVLDRMNSRFSEYVDIAMPADKIDEALQFGIQDLEVGVVSK